MSFDEKSNLRTPPLGRRLRLGFVGGGRGGLVGEWHFSGARLSKHWDVVAGALSSRPDNAAASARDWMIDATRSYTDFHKMAAAEAARPDGIEAVSICTPNASHAAIAEAFLTAGIDVILDKPMTTTVEDARRLVDLSLSTGRVVVMTYPFAQHAMVRQARALIAQGAVGAVRQVHVEYLQEWNAAPQEFVGAVWRQDPAKVGRSSIIGDIGTHAYNLLHAVTGRDVTEVRADMHVCGAAKPLPDTAFVNLRLSNGAPGMLHVSQAAPGQYCGLQLRVWGEKGGIEWDQEKPEVLKYVPLGGAEQHFIRGSGNGMLPEAEELVHLPRGHGEALTDAWANLYALAGVAIAARRSGVAVDNARLKLSLAEDGLRGMLFIDACADSHEGGGIWTRMQAI
jgi:predicted dehydrogenase